MPHTLTKKDFDPAERNEHFLIFLESEGYAEGDTLENHAYTLWVSERVADLKRQHGLRSYDSLGNIPDWRNTFTNHLRSLLSGKEDNPCTKSNR